MSLFDAEHPNTGERFEPLLTHRNVLIERIVSSAHVEPTWYDQAQDEWVTLLRGRARVELAREGDRTETAALGPGEPLFIPAHLRHRVLECSADALWLAVHIHPATPPAPCEIVEATLDEIASACAAVPELTPTSVESLQARLTGRPHLAQVAKIDGAVAGFKVGYAETPERFYSWIGGVLPAFRRRGLAQRLLEAQHAWCRERGFREVTVKTYNRYRGMLQLLVTAGYDVFAVQANGAVVLRKAL